VILLLPVAARGLVKVFSCIIVGSFPESQPTSDGMRR
jgi:hypothetical protein